MKLEVSPQKNRLILTLALAASLLSFSMAPLVLRDGLSFREAQSKIIKDHGLPALLFSLYEVDAGRAIFAQALYFGGFLGSLLTFYALGQKYWVEEKELMEVLIVGIVVVYLMNAGIILTGLQTLFA